MRGTGEIQHVKALLLGPAAVLPRTLASAASRPGAPCACALEMGKGRERSPSAMPAASGWATAAPRSPAVPAQLPARGQRVLLTDLPARPATGSVLLTSTCRSWAALSLPTSQPSTQPVNQRRSPRQPAACPGPGPGHAQPPNLRQPGAGLRASTRAVCRNLAGRAGGAAPAHCPAALPPGWRARRRG